MIALSEIRELPVSDRLRIVNEIWDSIADDQRSLPDPPNVLAELRRLKARFAADPSSGISWADAKKRIRKRDA